MSQRSDKIMEKTINNESEINKARNAPPDKKVVTEIENVSIELKHCGEFLIKKSEIVGWFHPIPLVTWARIIGFHRHISLTNNSESVSYHRFNPISGKYDTIIPYQISSKNGLHVNTPWDSSKNKTLLDRYAQRHKTEFFPANTIHTHVNASAFESGTDAGDEEDLPGWHITLGHLRSYLDYEIHCRFRLPKLPKVKKFTSVERSYVIPAKHLFEKNIAEEEITRQSDSNTDWHNFIDRVSYH